MIWRTANTFHSKGHCGQIGGYCWDGENETVLRQVDTPRAALPPLTLLTLGSEVALRALRWRRVL